MTIKWFSVVAVLLLVCAGAASCVLLILLLFRVNIVNSNLNQISSSNAMASEQQQQCTVRYKNQTKKAGVQDSWNFDF